MLQNSTLDGQSDQYVVPHEAQRHKKYAELSIHPAAEMFPLMEGDDLQALADDIRQNEQETAVVFYEGQLLDGRNRWRACELAGVEPDECCIDPEGDFDPVAYVLSVNMHRRHLDKPSRAIVAGKAKEMYAQQAKQRQQQSKGRGQKGPALLPDVKGDARDMAGKQLGVSGRYADYGEKVAAIKCPELEEAVHREDLTLPKAAKVAEHYGDADAVRKILKSKGRHWPSVVAHVDSVQRQRNRKANEEAEDDQPAPRKRSRLLTDGTHLPQQEALAPHPAKSMKEDKSDWPPNEEFDRYIGMLEEVRGWARQLEIVALNDHLYNAQALIERNKMGDDQ
ncbi:MAG: hypothetical protein WDZ59_11775 [Pirellulales bacterium]